MEYPTVTIIIPMRNEEAFIASCLASLRAQRYQADRLEFLVMDGDSTDRSADIVTAIAGEDPRVRRIPNPGRTQAAGMNLGIAEAGGEIIVRADAHAVYGPDYVGACVRHLTAGEAENVGGLQRGTGTTYFSRAVAAAQNSAFGAGGAAYRLATAPCYTDTVWLGSWYKRTLVEIGGFNEWAVTNEDYEANCRLRARGGRILLDPSLESTYYVRGTLPLLWRQYFRYGLGKVRTWTLHPRSLKARQIIPPLFVLALLAAAALAALTPLPLRILGGTYLLAALLAALHTGIRRGVSLIPALLIIFPTMHLAWGLGFLWGLGRHGFPRRPTT
ncbi:MAG TPA: glycosyltransferase family 2 protein [Armatimonadota bacterium]|nr:glycosyltransferase family 2 protein [Armatimonadota bacterium]HOS44188.1 glycosyltransferase family 2 protein [Armatimonadota bacterium]